MKSRWKLALIYAAVALPLAVGAHTNENTRLIWVDREGNASPLLDSAGDYAHPRLSPDGSKLVVEVRSSGSRESQIWLYDLARGTTRSIESDRSPTRPMWTPDGSGITYTSRDGGVFVQPLAETEERTMLIRWDGGIASAWLPSGDAVLTVRSTSIGTDIWRLSTHGEHDPVVNGEADEHSPQISKDGRWLAYVSNASGLEEVYLQPYPGPGRAMTVSTGGGTDPRWSPLGGELFYRNGNDMMVVAIQTRPHAIVGRPRKLFELPFLEHFDPADAAYDPSGDGERFVTTRPIDGVVR